MNRIQRVLFAIAIIMSCGAFSSSAQIYVSIRPARPVYVVTSSPGPGYVWIEEDWNGVGDRYEWRGGYWAAPPQPGYSYRKGYWRHSSRGNHWTPGRWHNGSVRQRSSGYRGNNGHPANNGNHGYKGNNGNHGHKGNNGNHNGHGKHNK